MLTYKDIKTQSDAVLYFLQQLDIEMIDIVLESKRTYQDFDKPIFVEKLGDALAEFMQSGDTFLNSYSGICNSEICNYKCEGFTFVGNNSKNYFNLIFEIIKGEVYDIYECTDFKSSNEKVLKNNRIAIDKSNFKQ